MNVDSITSSRRRTATALVFGLTAWAAQPAPAQELDYGAFEALFGEPVTTSVTGAPQRASEVPATLEIITREDIRRSGAHDIPGMLSHVTGVNVLDWTNSGSDVSVRGYNRAFSSRLLVLVNGRQVYADHYGYTPWSTLPIELGEIRQIEIVKGPNSALYGFNAVGGVVNIVTLDPGSDDVDFVHARGGTQDLVEAGAAVTLPLTSAGSVRISGGARSSDDYSTPVSSAETFTRRGDERRSLRLDGHFRVSRSTELEIEASYANAEQTNMAPNYVLGFEDTDVRSFKAAVVSDTGLGLVEGMVYRNWIDNDVYAGTTVDGIDFFDPGAPISVFDNEVTVAKARNIFKAGAAHTLRVSGEWRETTLPTSPYEGGVIAYDVIAGGLMWQWQISPSLSWTNALRQDRLDLERRGAMPAGLGLTNADWNRSLDETSFNSGLVWELTETDTLRFIAARGAQLPNLFNLGGNLIEYPVPPAFQPPELVYTAGLPGLPPTVVSNYEIAWTRVLPAMRGTLKLALFRGETEDVVADSGAFDLTRAIIGGPVAIGDSSMEGLEISLEGRFLEHGRWRIGYIREDVDDAFDPVRFPAGLTYRNFEDTTPEYVVDASAGWAGNVWEADVFLRYQPDTHGLRFPTEFDFASFTIPDVLVDISDFVAVDARVAYRLSDSMTLSLSGQNLLDDEQQQTSGPLVERRVLASFRFGF